MLDVTAVLMHIRPACDVSPAYAYLSPGEATVNTCFAYITHIHIKKKLLDTHIPL